MPTLKKKGDFVQTWWDSGAMGAEILYGKVVKAGDVTYTVEWVSGLRNRVTQDNPDIKLARNTEAAREEWERLGKVRRGV